MSTAVDLLFARSKVDAAWAAEFEHGLASDSLWLDHCADAVARHYEENPAVRDGYSRIGWGLMQVGRRYEAMAFFERDLKLGRMERWQFLRHLENLVELGEMGSAEACIPTFYANHRNACDGWAVLAAQALRHGAHQRARELLHRDHAAGRLSPVLVLELAKQEARAGNQTVAENLVEEAYATDARLYDGFARVGFAAQQAGTVSSCLPFLVRDFGLGRLSATWMSRATDMWSRAERDRVQLIQVVSRLARWLPEERRVRIGESILRDGVKAPGIREFLREEMMRDGRLVLAGAELEFSDEHSLRVLIEEILVFENYWFETANSRPLILDAGANFGLATYYFLQRFPAATILAFEPDPTMAAMLRRNVKRNQWENVRVIEAALAGRRDRAVFHATPGRPMAGSLTMRMSDQDVTHTTYEVECHTLREYLGEEVDFLKLDIEGAECEVLASSADGIGRVHNLFCEYHRQPGQGHDDLAIILRVLETAGFDVELAGPNRVAPGSDRGVENVRRRRSLQLWATLSPSRHSSSGAGVTQKQAPHGAAPDSIAPVNAIPERDSHHASARSVL